MNSHNDNIHSVNDPDNSKNMMKIQQLSELGLEFFDTELDNDTLTLNLLNQDSLSAMNGPNSSKDTVTVDFSNLNDFVSEGIISTLSPEENQVPIITVLPVTNEVLVQAEDHVPVTIEETEYQDSALGDTLSSDGDVLSSIPKKQVNGSNLNKNVSKPFSNIIYTILDKPDDSSKNIKIKPKTTPDNIETTVVSKDDSSKFFMRNSEKTAIQGSKNNLFMNDLADCSDLDNKINDSLLDMLQDKIIGKNANSVNSFRTLNKPPERLNEKEVSKFITIFPSKCTNKVINLMVKGKTCRSKQPLTDIELRIVTRILSQENSLQNKESVYRNVFYDAESDSNVRYEVRRDVTPEENNLRSDINLIKNKKGRCKNNQGFEETNQDASKSDEKYLLKSVARTRCGRVSRPPRHVIRDYKRLKHLTAHASDVEDENENTGGYADYQLVDDPNKQNVVNEKQKETENLLYGPLEPNKRQFSSLSICPTCNKVYLGYRRMAIHFQKYPDHKNEELLKRLLEAKKKSFDETMLSDSSEINTNEEILVNGPTNRTNGVTSRTNGAIKRKRRLCRKIKMPMKNNGISLKELLPVCDVDEIIKYAAPVVAGFLSSWEYLLIRSNKLKTKDETLASLVLKEIVSVLKQIRSLSQCLLKPYVEDNENIANKFVIEEEDVLRHVLGIKPGTYVASENDTWTREFYRFTTCFQDIQPNQENASSTNAVIAENTNQTTSDCIQNSNSNGTVIDDSEQFYHDDRLAFPTLEFSTESQNIPSDLDLSNSTLNSIAGVDSTVTSLSNYDKNVNPDKSMELFKNLSNGGYNDTSAQLNQTLTINSIMDPKRKLINEVSNSGAYSPDALSFDSFVNTEVDMMNDFPISLPLLSDNSSDSKDCLHLLQTSSAEDILNSLKTMENTSESVIAELNNAMSSNLPLSNTHGDNLSSTFVENVNENTSPCILDFESISSNFNCDD